MAMIDNNIPTGQIGLLDHINVALPLEMKFAPDLPAQRRVPYSSSFVPSSTERVSLNRLYCSSNVFEIVMSSFNWVNGFLKSFGRSSLGQSNK